MLPLKIPEHQYVLSLDSIDMSFLEQYVEKPPDEKRVLWSKPALKEEIEYIQIELMPEKEEEEDSYTIESSATYMCHICNKDVPQVYFSQHIQSKMHQNHKKLTDRVLQNLSKQINAEIANIENITPNNMFYCETCSKLVPLEHKKKHKRSQYHLKSIEIEKLTDDFLEVYCYTHTEALLLTEGKKKARARKRRTKAQQNDAKEEIINPTDPEKQSSSDSESDYLNPFSKKYNTIFPINDVHKTRNTLNSYKMDHKTVNNEESIENVINHKPAIDLNDTLTNVNVGNENERQKIYKTCENFETFSDTDWSDSIGESDTEVTKQRNLHDESNSAGPSSHVAASIADHQIAKPNIPLPKPPIIINKECVEFILYLKRMVEKYKLKYDLPMVEGNTIVIVTPKGYKENISIDAFHGFSRLSNFAYCHLCFKCIDVDTKEHSETEIHVRNILKPINDDFAREWIRNKYVVAHCLLCNETLPGNSNHAASSPNHKKHREMIAKHKNEPVKSENVCKKKYCEICKIQIDAHNFTTHTCSRVHMFNMLTSNPTPAEYCDICKVKVPKAGMGIHEAGKPHKEAKLAAQANNKVPKSDAPKDKPTPVDKNITSQITSTNMEYCATCKVKVPKGGMAVHEAGKSHKNLMIAKLANIAKDLNVRVDRSAGMSKDASASSVQQKNTAGLTTEEKLIEYNKQMAIHSKSEVECLVCKSKVASSHPHIIEHVEGARHTSAVAILLRENQIEKLSAKIYYCQLCKINFGNFVNHVQENLGHLVKKTLSSGMIDKDILRNYVYQNPNDCSTMAIAYRKVYETLLDRNKIVRLPNSQFNCKVCLIKMTRISEFDHMFGERHKTVLELKSRISPNN